MNTGSSRELLDVFGKPEGSNSSGGGTGSSGGGGGGRRCVSVNDIRRAFEKAEQSLAISSLVKGQACTGNGAYGQGISPSHNRMSSLDSTTSDESSIPTPHNYYGSVSSLVSGRENLKDHYGSISSLASSTSLISPHVRNRGSSLKSENVHPRIKNVIITASFTLNALFF